MENDDRSQLIDKRFQDIARRMTLKFLAPRDPNEPGWHWRNLRTLSIGVDVSLWPWSRWSFGGRQDVYGGDWHVAIGPVGLSLSYDHGDPNDWFGLSMCECWDRACRAEGIDPEAWNREHPHG